MTCFIYWNYCVGVTHQGSECCGLANIWSSVKMHFERFKTFINLATFKGPIQFMCCFSLLRLLWLLPQWREDARWQNHMYPFSFSHFYVLGKLGKTEEKSKAGDCVAFCRRGYMLFILLLSVRNSFVQHLWLMPHSPGEVNLQLQARGGVEGDKIALYAVNLAPFSHEWETFCSSAQNTEMGGGYRRYSTSISNCCLHLICLINGIIFIDLASVTVRIVSRCFLEPQSPTPSKQTGQG